MASNTSNAGLPPLIGSDVGLTHAGLTGVLGVDGPPVAAADQSTVGEPASMGSSDRWYTDQSATDQAMIDQPITEPITVASHETPTVVGLASSK